LFQDKCNTHLNPGGVAVLVDVVDAAGVEGGRAANDAVDLEVLESWKQSLNNWDIAIGNRHCVSEELSHQEQFAKQAPPLQLRAHQYAKTRPSKILGPETERLRAQQ